jgi:hypothetical protein
MSICGLSGGWRVGRRAGAALRELSQARLVYQFGHDLRVDIRERIPQLGRRREPPAPHLEADVLAPDMRREVERAADLDPHRLIAVPSEVLSQSAWTTSNLATEMGGANRMRAGGGVWHTGTTGPGRVRGFQLWVALPPELENDPNASHYVMPEHVPADGPVRVILGAYGSATSRIAAPPMTYLVVSLRDGERWSYHPPKGHDVAWVSLMDGALQASTRITHGEVAIFEHSEAPIDFVAEGDTRFVLGSAILVVYLCGSVCHGGHQQEGTWSHLHEFAIFSAGMGRSLDRG